MRHALPQPARAAGGRGQPALTLDARAPAPLGTVGRWLCDAADDIVTAGDTDDAERVPPASLGLPRDWPAVFKSNATLKALVDADGRPIETYEDAITSLVRRSRVLCCFLPPRSRLNSRARAVVDCNRHMRRQGKGGARRRHVRRCRRCGRGRGLRWRRGRRGLGVGDGDSSC